MTIRTAAPSGERHIVALPHGLHTPAVARRVTARWLLSAGAGPERTADAVLIVSELVTNAVLHSRGPCVLTLAMRGAAVDIAVADRSEEMPQLPAGPADRASHRDRTEPVPRGGFGMVVIGGLGGRTTVVPALGGKTVHVRLDLALPLGGGHGHDAAHGRDRRGAGRGGPGPRPGDRRGLATPQAVS
ncbi:ATP-binding protein [Streptomyces sp. NBC_01216]|uniref:ATP-binding protein n=1 Tax=Streptomyces sp. NBC_01216 TaxID=2903778 RepID=UPI002E12A2A1|nr:ATP-binding protein [Streptomyces sp. NBC_01216]